MRLGQGILPAGQQPPGFPHAGKLLVGLAIVQDNEVWLGRGRQLGAMQQGCRLSVLFIATRKSLSLSAIFESTPPGNHHRSGDPL